MEVRTPETREQVNMVLDCLRRDREKSRTMQADGRYIREEGGSGTSSQEALYQYFSRRRVSLDQEPSGTAEDAKPVRRIPQEKTEPFWTRLRRGFKTLSGERKR